jgi:hypothetical protein
VLTAIIGVTLVTDAAAQVTLAFTVSPATFGLVAHIAAWVIVGIGLAVCVLYLGWTAQRHRDRMRPPGPEPTPGSHSPPTEPREMPT